MTTEIAKPSEFQKPTFLKDQLDTIKKVNSALSQLKSIGENVDDFENSLLLGHYLNELKENITDSALKIMRNLMNTSIGFKTDRKDGYDDNIIKNCIIEAYMYGLRPTNNEFNILQGNFYVTKNGLDRLVHSKPGLEKIEILQKGMQQSDKTKTWKVTYSYYFKLKGLEEVKGEKDIYVNGFMGRSDKEIPMDAVQGKAYRKILHFIYSKMNVGLQIPEGEIGEESSGTFITQLPQDMTKPTPLTSDTKLDALLNKAEKSEKAV